MSKDAWQRFDKDCTLDPLTPVTRVDRYGFRYKWHVRALIDGHVFYLGHGEPPPEPMPDARPKWLIEADKAHVERLIRKPDAARPDPKPNRQARSKRPQ